MAEVELPNPEESILSTSRRMFWFSLVLAVLGTALAVNGFVPLFSLPFLRHD